METITKQIEKPPIASVLAREVENFPQGLKSTAAEIIDRIPAAYKHRYVLALAGKLTPGQSIKMKCAECVGFEEVKARVGGCTCYRCPLWQMRPFQTEAEESDSE